MRPRRLVVNGIEIYEDRWDEAIRTLSPRAAYDLQCSANSLEYMLLQRHGREASSVAVRGCGRTQAYVNVAERWIRDGGAASLSAGMVVEEDRRQQQHEERQQQERQLRERQHEERQHEERQERQEGWGNRPY